MSAGRRETRVFYALIALYALVLFALIDRQTLWLDEILQLVGTTDTFDRMIAYIPSNPGASPLGYFVQAVSVRVLGDSPFGARFPSVIFSILSCICLFQICRRLKLAWPWLPVAIFMILPLQLRYALEGRIYAQGLFANTLATFLLLRVLDRPSLTGYALYGLSVLLSLYTQPFALFVPLGHMLWVVCCSDREQRGRLTAGIALAIGCAGVLFLPWFLYSKGIWIASLGPTLALDQGFHLDWRTPLMIFREITSAGYWGSALVLIAAVIGWRSPVLSRGHKLLVLATILLPVIGPVAADAVFGYFLAIRQMIFAITGIAVLAGVGVVYALGQRRWVGILLGGALGVVCLRYDVMWLTKPREDWKAATELVTSRAGDGCIRVIPESAILAYGYYRPELKTRICDGDQKRVLLAISPYAVPREVDQVINELKVQGLVGADGGEAGGTRALVFE